VGDEDPREVEVIVAALSGVCETAATEDWSWPLRDKASGIPNQQAKALEMNDWERKTQVVERSAQPYLLYGGEQQQRRWKAGAGRGGSGGRRKIKIVGED
jgi:hypothetical protein